MSNEQAPMEAVKTDGKDVQNLPSLDDMVRKS